MAKNNIFIKKSNKYGNYLEQMFRILPLTKLKLKISVLLRITFIIDGIGFLYNYSYSPS